MRAGRHLLWSRLPDLRLSRFLAGRRVSWQSAKRPTFRRAGPASNGLPDAYLREMAVYFAGQDVPYPPPARVEASAALVERGRLLVREGDPARAIPSCASCHGASLAGVAPAIPGLLGLPRDYLVAQIGSWQNGLRRAAEPDCMAQVSLKLTPEDIGAVSAWLASRWDIRTRRNRPAR